LIHQRWFISARRSLLEERFSDEDLRHINDLVVQRGKEIGLRYTLKAIGVLLFYTLTVNKEALGATMKDKLQGCVNLMQALAMQTDAIPLILLSMHVANEGIALTNNTFIRLQELKTLFLSYNYIKGYDPFVCIASYNGNAV